MKYLAAYLLAQLNGQPTLESITTILTSVGVEVDEQQVNTIISQLDGKDINEVIAEGQQKLASVPSGGGAVAAAPAGGKAAASASAAVVEEKEEEKEESDDDMGFGLFD
jgi:large subunit ribosomal protein LP2